MVLELYYFRKECGTNGTKAAALVEPKLVNEIEKYPFDILEKEITFE